MACEVRSAIWGAPLQLGKDGQQMEESLADGGAGVYLGLDDGQVGAALVQARVADK
jgi:hypothetical protein